MVRRRAQLPLETEIGLVRYGTSSASRRPTSRKCWRVHRPHAETPRMIRPDLEGPAGQCVSGCGGASASRKRPSHRSRKRVPKRNREWLRFGYDHPRRSLPPHCFDLRVSTHLATPCRMKPRLSSPDKAITAVPADTSITTQPLFLAAQLLSALNADFSESAAGSLQSKIIPRFQFELLVVVSGYVARC